MTEEDCGNYVSGVAYSLLAEGSIDKTRAMKG
jgi:hypothetical protein